MKEFGPFVKERKIELGLMSKDICKATGLSMPAMTRIENGDFTPCPGKLYAMALLLQIEPFELFNIALTTRVEKYRFRLKTSYDRSLRKLDLTKK